MSQGKRYVGKIGWCENADLKINKPSGHYVYIRGYNGNTCTVSTFTSLEDSNRKIHTKRMQYIRNGNVYPIPKKDASFSRWTGLNQNRLTVETSKIQHVGCKKVKRKHLFMFGSK